MTVSCLVAPSDAQAVFVEDAPSLAKSLAQIEARHIPTQTAVDQLIDMRANHGHRLIQASDSDPDLFIQLNQAIASLIARDSRLARAVQDGSHDALLQARTSAADGALASARRWLLETPQGDALRAHLQRTITPAPGRSALHHGDALPNDLVASPMWANPAKGNGTMPVVTGDALVLSGPGQVESIDVLTGERLWHRESLAGIVVSPTAAYGGMVTVDTVRGGDIVAWIGQPVASGFEGGGRIMRLDATNGALKWDFDPATLDDDTGALRPSGPPLVADSAVFIPMRRHGRALQVESWLLALDLESGAQRWIRFLGAAGAATRGVVWPGDEVISTDNSIVVQTGTGVLATIDPRNGAIDWLRRMTPGRWTTRSESAPPPWALSRPVRIGSHIATLSADHEHLLVLDAATGHIETQLSTAPGTPAQGLNALFSIGDDALLTTGASVIRWTLHASGTLAQEWTWTDNSHQHATGRPHLSGDAVLVPLGDQLVALHLEDGIPLTAIEHKGGGHVASVDGFVVLTGPNGVSVVTGLQSGLSRLTNRMQAMPEQPEPGLAIIDLAVRANRPDLVQTHLPGVLTVASKVAPSQAIDATIETLRILDSSAPSDRGLIDAAVQVLTPSGHTLAKLHLARGDWVEQTSTDAAIEAWLAADANPSSQTWASEDGVLAPVGALASRRLARYDLEHAIEWPPPSIHAGANIRRRVLRATNTAQTPTSQRVTATNERSHTDAISLIANASGVDAIAIATVANFDQNRIDAMRAASAPALHAGGQATRLQGAAINVPKQDGLLLNDGSRLVWHESPLVEAAWAVRVEGSLHSVIAIDDTQLVLVLERLGGGRLLESRRRDDGSIQWTLNLDQFAEEIDPPIVLASTSAIAVLGGRDRVYLVDLHNGLHIGQAPKGWPVDAIALQHHIVLLLDDPSTSRSTLHVVDAQGRIEPWPQPPHLPRATWLDGGPLGGVVLGDANALAFAPGPGDQWWWLADLSADEALHGAIVLPEAIITRSNMGLIDRRDPHTGVKLGPIETAFARDGAQLIDAKPTGDGLLVTTDQGILKFDAAGSLLWADATQSEQSPSLAIISGNETLVIEHTDLLHDALLPTESRTMHRIKRLDAHGRLVETVELFPVAGRIHLGRAIGGMVLLSDTLDTWLVPLLPSTGSPSP